jgi:hypothetical protein
MATSSDFIYGCSEVFQLLDGICESLVYGMSRKLVLALFASCLEIKPEASFYIFNRGHGCSSNSLRLRKWSGIRLERE